MDKPDDLVSVYQGENVTESHFVKNLINDEGIDAVVAGEHEPFSLPWSHTDVLVRRADEARARAIVDRYDAEQERRAERPDWTCAACGAAVVGAFDQCDVCGADRPGSEEPDEE